MPWESFPGPELSRSRRLEPSAFGWAGLEPSRRLLKSLGLEPEGLDRVLKQSRPNGGRGSRPIIERSELESADGEEELMMDTKKLISGSCVFEGFEIFSKHSAMASRSSDIRPKTQ